MDAIGRGAQHEIIGPNRRAAGGFKAAVRPDDVHSARFINFSGWKRTSANIPGVTVKEDLSGKNCPAPGVATVSGAEREDRRLKTIVDGDDDGPIRLYEWLSADDARMIGRRLCRTPRHSTIGGSTHLNEIEVTIVVELSITVTIEGTTSSIIADAPVFVVPYASSPFYGHCYTEWDDNGNGNLVQMSTSTDGGLTWGTRKSTANNATVIGGQPLVQPNGTVIVPIENASETSLLSFISTNGGSSWNSTITVTSIRHHTDAGSLRSGSLPTAEIDGTGKVYVVWSDCRFERNCRANDLVLTTSTNGTSWTTVTRIPANAVGSGVDHFIPGLAVDKSTSGSSAHLGLAYYYYPTASCSTSTCKLDVGFISSTNGGSTWSSATQLAGPMTLTWLANTSQGFMVGDYISTSFANGTAHPVFEVATANNGSVFNEATYSPASGLTIRSGNLSGNGATVVATASSTSGNSHQYR